MQAMAVQDFQHCAQRGKEGVSDFIGQLEKTFHMAYGHEAMSRNLDNCTKAWFFLLWRYASSSVSCYNCRKPGHIAQDCPQPRRESAWKVQTQAPKEQRRRLFRAKRWRMKPLEFARNCAECAAVKGSGRPQQPPCTQLQ